MNRSIRFETLKILDNDRSLLTEDNKRLISNDLKKMLSEFFEIKGEVCIGLKQESGVYKLEVNADVIRVKTFQILH